MLDARQLEAERRLVEASQRQPRRFAQLYERYFDRVYAFALTRTGHRTAAEDVTAETFRLAFENLSRFEWRGVPFSAWLFRIAHNLAMDHFRASRRLQPEEEVPEPVGEEEPSAEAAAMQSLGRQSMLELIEDLSQDQKQVLTLKFVFNLKNAEVATILGKTEGAIKSSMLSRPIDCSAAASADGSDSSGGSGTSSSGCQRRVARK